MTQSSKPTAPETPPDEQRRAADVLSALRSDELEQINRQHDFSLRAVKSGGLLARFRSRLRAWLLGDYLAAEQEFNAHLVRHLNEVSARLERSLVRLEDRREGSVYTLERRISAELERMRSELNNAVGANEKFRAGTDTRLQTVESVSRGLERIMARLKPASPLTQDSAPEAAPSVDTDYRYVMLENRFRGSEDEIEARLLPYEEVFAAAPAPVYELGSGRGELQRLFRTAGIPSYGYEQDAAMAKRCSDDGLDVRFGDGIKHLREIPAQSIGGFIAVQVVEHLPYSVLTELLELLSAKLKPGSRAVLETINSESMLALTRNYFRDPTHVAPLHPETLRFLVEMAGLKVIEVRKLSPYPAAAELQQLPSEGYYGPRMRETVEILNRNIRALNELLFGFQDYCIIAEAS